MERGNYCQAVLCMLPGQQAAGGPRHLEHGLKPKEDGLVPQRASNYHRF